MGADIAINYERRTYTGLRWSFGFGMVAAACVNDLLDIVGIKEHVHESSGMDSNVHIPFHSHDNDEVHSHATLLDQFGKPVISDHEEEGFMGGIWNTAQVGLAVPLGGSWMFQSEIGLVMKGVKIATEDWVGGPPVILTLGVTYSF